jgi:tetratricopeptide (TPR) repeat protein
MLIRIHALLIFWRARINRHYGIMQHDRKAFSEAVRWYGEALKFDPGLSRAYLERGILHWRELNEPAKAIRDLTVALELRPAWPYAHFCRGLAQQAAGNFAAAIEDLTAYLESGERIWYDEAARQLSVLRVVNADLGSPSIAH